MRHYRFHLHVLSSFKGENADLDYRLFAASQSLVDLKFETPAGGETDGGFRVDGERQWKIGIEPLVSHQGP